MPLFACGSIHQGNERFSSESRGRQCSYISLSALLVDQTIPVFEWNSETIDSILLLGDRMYLHALGNGLIPNAESLSVDNLPTVVRSNNLAHLLAPNNHNDNGSIVNVTHNRNLSIESLHLKHNATSPVMVTNNNLPIVVEPIEAQNNLLNANLFWFINYGESLQGLVTNENQIGAPYFTLHSALMNTFTHHKYAILILEGYMMALIHGLHSVWYVFDSHARNSTGMPDPNGTAVVMSYANINALEQYLHSLSSELNNNSFEITPVEFVPLNFNYDNDPMGHVLHTSQTEGAQLQTCINVPMLVLESEIKRHITLQS